MVCYHCTKRHTGCHSKCLDYAAYVETLSQRKREEGQEYAQYLTATKLRIEKERKKFQK